MTRLEELRTRHPRMIYKSYSWRQTDNGFEVTFEFILEPDVVFRPSLTFLGVTDEQQLPLEEIHWFIFHIGLVELFSYWKTACPAEISIEAGDLSQEQLTWWKNLLLTGMGEFFYVNGIDFTKSEFVNLSAVSDKDNTVFLDKLNRNPARNTIMIPIGGGKDSVVTIEAFTHLQTILPDLKLVTLRVNPTEAANDINILSNVSKGIVIDRKLDRQLLELNDQNYLNGHTPFSALLAFLSTFAARLTGCTHIAVSNEQSANEENTEFYGHAINHQYSKTFQFEKDFQNYISTYTKGNLNNISGDKAPLYFSYLRPIYELQIGKAFARFKKYHSSFRSCNRGQKTNSWCGECSKCLFAYVILFPFFDFGTLSEHFGKDIFTDESLLSIALELVGKGQNKPLECVGTYEESTIAFYLSAEKYSERNQPLPALLEAIQSEVLASEKDLENRAQRILSAWSENHAIPPSWEQPLHDYVK